MATRTPRNWPVVFARGHFRCFVDLFSSLPSTLPPDDLLKVMRH